MKKKNQKKSPQQVKMEQAHQKNLFLKKLKSMMGTIGGKSAFDLLDQKTIEALYLFRMRPIKFRTLVYDGRTLPTKILDTLNHNLNYLLQNTIIDFDVHHFSVNLYDFYVYVQTIYFFWRTAISLNFQNAKLFRDSFPVFNDRFELVFDGAMEVIEEKVNTIAWLFSDITHYVLWMEFESIKTESTSLINNPAFYTNCFIHYDEPESISLEIDGNKRTIYRVGVSLAKKGINWLTITPEELGVINLMSKYPLKIYIQQHAVDRFTERLGIEFKHYEYFTIISAITEKNIFPADDGSFLFIVKHMSQKVGYLKADIIGDKLLIRTFLFITNNGTPEGKKLASLIGIQKEDKKYLGIDKLSTFLHSDIEKNERLKQLFCDAGCEGLFELKKQLNKKEDHIIHCANYISGYLGLEKGKEL